MTCCGRIAREIREQVLAEALWRWGRLPEGVGQGQDPAGRQRCLQRHRGLKGAVCPGSNMFSDPSWERWGQPMGNKAEVGTKDSLRPARLPASTSHACGQGPLACVSSLAVPESVDS